MILEIGAPDAVRFSNVLVFEREQSWAGALA